MNHKNQDFQDDFLFKPLNKGLGFHHPQNDSLKISSAARAAAEKITNPNNSKIPNNKTTQKPSTIPRLGMSHNVGHKNTLATSQTSLGLQNFDFANEHDLDQPELAMPARQLISAQNSLRFIAWSLDMTFLLLIFAISIFGILKCQQFDWNRPLQLLQSEFFIYLYGPLFLGLYLFYFSLFEKACGQTFGKMILGLKVQQVAQQQPPNLWQSFARSILNILSIATLGLFSIYNVINWTLGLKIVKTKND